MVKLVIILLSYAFVIVYYIHRYRYIYTYIHTHKHTYTKRDLSSREVFELHAPPPILWLWLRITFWLKFKERCSTILPTFEEVL